MRFDANERIAERKRFSKIILVGLLLLLLDIDRGDVR